MILFRALACALGFLTRIPAPRVEVTPAVLGLSAGFFPLVGLILGGLWAGLFWLLRDVPPHPLWTVVYLAVSALATGALHLDGLSDLADGLGGGRGDRARALEIMRDPRIGAFGVVTLALFLAAKGLVLHEALRMPRAFALLLVAPAVARFVAVPLLAFFPPARPDGLARAFRERCGAMSLLLAAGTAGAALWWAAAWRPAGIAVAAGLLVAAWAAVRLKGLTGDAIGAAVETAELAFLFAAAAPRFLGGQT
jgi:adenosylcobinamide-GDP ribazoletransferase